MYQVLQGFSHRLTAMAIGALAAEGIYFWAVNSRMLNWDPYGTALWPVIGVVLGLLVYEDTHRSPQVVTTGIRTQVLLWTLGGAMIGGGLGLAIRHFGAHSLLGWLPLLSCGEPMHTVLFWGGIGAVVTMQCVDSYLRPAREGT